MIHEAARWDRMLAAAQDDSRRWARVAMAMSRVGLALLSCLFTALAQPASPRIGYVFPAGGRVGTTFQATVAGQRLAGVTNAWVTGTGVSARIQDFEPLLTGKQQTELRERLAHLQSRRRTNDTNQTAAQRATVARTNAPSNSAWDHLTAADIRRKLAQANARRTNPALAEVVTLSVSIDAKAAPGTRELRLETGLGLSNPLVFQVGTLPEHVQPSTPSAQPTGATETRRADRSRPTPTRSRDPFLERLPLVINGQILPGESDRYRFRARAGQELVAAVQARALIPYLPDAVPGWFQAILTLYDEAGRELICVDDFQFDPDPVAHYRVEREGEYVIEVKDAVSRGRADFVYRLTLGELPFVTGVFPLGAPAGSKATIVFEGWNLPQRTNQVDTRHPGIRLVGVEGGPSAINTVPFLVGEPQSPHHELIEAEPNSDRTNAPTLPTPALLNGRINTPGDVDVFRIEARTAEDIVAEIWARRLGSPLDSVLELVDSAGRRLGFNDDCEDSTAGLITHHADAYLRARLPNAGSYFLRVMDAQGHGGEAYAYRLRVSSPQPDFALRVAPSSVAGPAGATIPVSVYARRLDGFDGGIDLALTNAPMGMSIAGAWMPPGQDRVRITLTLPREPSTEPMAIGLIGRAKVDGRSIVRAAVPADEATQAFAYRHWVPRQEWAVMVKNGGRSRPTVHRNVNATSAVRIPAGGLGRVRLETAARPRADRWRLELSEPPEGISLESATPSARGVELVFRAELDRCKPGLAGNLIVQVFPNESGTNRPTASLANNARRGPIDTLPAIPFEVISK